jgi:hypothetical protein
MFRLKVEREIALFKEKGLPGFLREIDEGIVRPWREHGYRTEFGEVELDSETADTGYYFDVRRKSVHFRLVIGVKETEGDLTVIGNVAFYPKETKYLLLGAAVAGVVTGTFFYYCAVEPYVFSPLEITAAWFLSVVAATAINFFVIRYFHARAKKYFRSGGRAGLEALALEREVRELARETLSEYGEFVAE